MAIINAKNELLRAIKGLANVKCATIESFVLKIGYSLEEYNQFLDSLNFEYDKGYGSQHLFGTVWLEDGTWLERGEYDGSEWWEHRICPEIPDICKP